MQKTLTLSALEEPLTPSQGEAARLWRTFKRNRVALIGLVLVVVIMAIAIAAPMLAPHDPIAQSARDRLTPPNSLYPLGRDDYGRDLFSRIIYGTRISLLVGLLSVLIGGIAGTIMGVVAGFKGGTIETIIMRVVDTLLAFPDLITGLLVLAVLGSGLDKMIIAIAIVISPRFARLAHGPTLALREKDFISSARSIGVGDVRMLSRHIIPNVAGELLVMASLWAAAAIRIEANLSFIGLGVAPPTPTWGQMIRDGTSHLTTAPWFSIAPGVAILITVLAFNLLGDGLRDVLDPKLQV
ncbi:ABC transporter permease [Chloroflexi bacterium TSY]|nr:ABC transporter permease [Chloroflexi bacterium TSY]